MSPVSPTGLAKLIGDLALAGPGLRLGIDGPVVHDTRALADAVAAELDRRAVPVARVHAGDFLRSRPLRLEHGPDDPEAFFDGWYDLAALRREVLDPMAAQDKAPHQLVPSGRSWLPRLRHPGTDRPYREPRRLAAPATVVVLDGMFLARWDVADGIDVLVHLDVSPAARSRRVPAGDQARVLPAWERYLAWCDPAAVATAVVRYDRPGHPAVRTRIT
jgi:hypothetical protein